MDLAITRHHARRADQGGGVEQLPLRAALQHADASPDAKFTAVLSQNGTACTGQRLGVRPGFRFALETITGQDALGKGDELSSPLRRFAQARANRVEIAWHLTNAAVHLDPGDLPGS